METSYGGAMVLPSSYVVMDQEEMAYVEGGATAIIRETAGQIRSRLNGIIASCILGNASAVALGAAIGSIVGAVVGFVIGNAWFGAILGYARTAHKEVEGIITKYGKNKNSIMTSTWSGIYCTSISVKIA